MPACTNQVLEVLNVSLVLLVCIKAALVRLSVSAVLSENTLLQYLQQSRPPAKAALLELTRSIQVHRLAPVALQALILP